MFLIGEVMKKSPSKKQVVMGQRRTLQSWQAKLVVMSSKLDQIGDPAIPSIQHKISAISAAIDAAVADYYLSEGDSNAS